MDEEQPDVLEEMERELLADPAICFFDGEQQDAVNANSDELAVLHAFIPVPHYPTSEDFTNLLHVMFTLHPYEYEDSSAIMHVETGDDIEIKIEAPLDQTSGPTIISTIISEYDRQRKRFVRNTLYRNDTMRREVFYLNDQDEVIEEVNRTVSNYGKRIVYMKILKILNDGVYPLKKFNFSQLPPDY